MSSAIASSFAITQYAIAQFATKQYPGTEKEPSSGKIGNSGVADYQYVFALTPQLWGELSPKKIPQNWGT